MKKVNLIDFYVWLGLIFCSVFAFFYICATVRSFLQEIFDLLCSFHGSPSEDMNFWSDAHDTEIEEASFSGQDDPNDLYDILE